jgi:twitching motility protein PilT
VKKSVIVHREVGEHTETFASALKGAMRHDPDILLVGEMRELETIKLALGCASMGMLVFGTLHTNNAPKTVDRIINAFPADDQNQVRVMLAGCLAGHRGPAPLQADPQGPVRGPRDPASRTRPWPTRCAAARSPTSARSSRAAAPTA